MSTQQTNPHSHRTHSTRTGAVAVALGALIAIGVSVLILTLTSANHTTGQNTAIQTHLASEHAAPTPSPPGYFRDPITHALTRIPTIHPRPGKVRAKHPNFAGP